MKLLHAASSFPLAPGDSTAPFMEEMLEALANRGHDVTIVVPRVFGLVEDVRSGMEVVGAPYAPQSLQVWGHGRSLDARNRLRFSAAAITPVAMASMVRSLRSEIRRKRPDVVHLHWVIPQGVMATAVPPDIPVVISVHGADVRFMRGRMKPIATRILRRADALVAASSDVLDAVSATYPPIRERSRVIPHGANSALLGSRDKREARVELGIDPSLPVVLAIGRLVSKKGFEHLIRSMAGMRDTGAHLYVIGEGPDRPRLEAAVSEVDLDRVSLLGAQPRDGVAMWLAASDVVVVPGVAQGDDVDTGPVVLMEALAAGRPVVATRMGMAPDVVRNGVNGFLIHSADPNLIVGALRAALADAERLGRGARRTFEGVGGWSRVALDLEKTYQEVLRTSRRRRGDSIVGHDS